MSPLFFWPVAVTLARGVGLLLSWLWQETHLHAGRWAWVRGVLVAISLGYVCYLLGGLIRLYFHVGWSIAAATVALVTVIQLTALAAIRRWAARHRATAGAGLIAIGALAIPGPPATAQAVAAMLYRCEHLPNGAPRLDTCRKVASGNPNNELARLALGLALEDAGQTEQALDEFRAAVTLDSNNAAAQYGVGAALSELGRPAEAVASFRAAMRLRPRFVDAALGLARALNLSGDPSHAVPVARDAVAWAPTNLKGYYSLAFALGSVGRLHDALATLETARGIAPTDASVWFQIGATLQRLDRWPEALDAFRGAARLAPNQPETWGALALTSAQLGRHAEAVSQWNRASKLDSTYFTSHADERTAYDHSLAAAGPQPPAPPIQDGANR